jgi:alpha,alpha-trehalase
MTDTTTLDDASHDDPTRATQDAASGWDRRRFLRAAGALVAVPVATQILTSRSAAASSGLRSTPSGTGLALPRVGSSSVSGTALPQVGKVEWLALDQQIRDWWVGDLVTMQEPDLAVHTNAQFEPFPYVPAGGSPGAFPFLFNWDTQFINRALFAHDRADLVRNHILDHLSQIERHDHVLNYNVVNMQRSQPPLLPDTVRRYHEANPDVDLLMHAYGLLKAEYQRFWLAPHHLTPTGLSTFRDIGRMDKQGAYYESGLDNTPVWGADVRDCVPLILNCALVKYADDMAWMATTIRRTEEVGYWVAESRRRAALIRRLCWDGGQGFFFEYDYQQGSQLPYWGVYAYWALWAGVATRAQAARLVQQLARFETPYGLAETDQAYPDPTGLGNQLWMYPLGWPPSQMNAVEGLDRYGYRDQARRIARKYVDLQVAIHSADATDYVWEKYDVVAGAAAGSPFHGWSAASVAVLGRRAFTI